MTPVFLQQLLYASAPPLALADGGRPLPPALPVPAEVWRHRVCHQRAAGAAWPLVRGAPDSGRLPGGVGGLEPGMRARPACMRGAGCCRLSARPLLLPFTARFNWRLTDNLHLHCVAPPVAWLQFTPIYNQHFGL